MAIEAPANVVAPVPPFPNANVPVMLVAAFTKVVDVVPVPPLAIGNIPVTPVVNGSPVVLVKTPADGVPRLGVVKDRLDANIEVVTVAESPVVTMFPFIAGSVNAIVLVVVPPVTLICPPEVD